MSWWVSFRQSHVLEEILLAQRETNDLVITTFREDGEKFYHGKNVSLIKMVPCNKKNEVQIKRCSEMEK